MYTARMKRIPIYTRAVHTYHRALWGLWCVWAVFCIVLPAQAAPSTAEALRQELIQLEAVHDGRIGVALLDTGSGTLFEHRGHERFPLCSTFKFMAVAALLHKAQSDPALLSRRVHFTRKDIVPFSPVIAGYLKSGITLKQICAAMLINSDNSAANLLLQELGTLAGLGKEGGPEAVTAFARSIGDDAFRIDRMEPEMNDAAPDDPRDTSTPVAMMQSLHQLTTTDILTPRHRQQLVDWMHACKTGNTRIRAGTPKGWVVANKTGTGGYGAVNDVAVIWPPGKSALILGIFFARDRNNAEGKSALVAEITRRMLRAVRSGQLSAS